MRLKYLKGKDITISERRKIGGISSPYHFTPYCEVPEYVGKRILRNPRYDGMFEENKTGIHVCEKCGKDFPHAGALNLHYSFHKRKEREKLEHEKNIAFNNDSNGTAPDIGTIAVSDIQRPEESK